MNMMVQDKRVIIIIIFIFFTFTYILFIPLTHSYNITAAVAASIDTINTTTTTTPSSSLNDTTTITFKGFRNIPYIFINKEEEERHQQLVISPPFIQSSTVHYRLRESTTNPKFNLYLHPTGDLVSDSFYMKGYWQDCLDHNTIITRYFRNERPEYLVIVDVGANIGSCSLFFLSLGYNVYAFEPMKSNYLLLNQSIYENQHLKGKIIALNAGVTSNISEEEGMKEEKIHSEIGNFGNSIVSKDGLSKEDIQHLSSNGGGRPSKYIESSILLTTLDNIVKEHVHYMKLDCQGCELSALRGAQRLLNEYKIDVIRLEFSYSWLNKQKQDPLDLLLLLHSHKYTIYKNSGHVLDPSIESLKAFVRHFEVVPGSNEDIIAVRNS